MTVPLNTIGDGLPIGLIGGGASLGMMGLNTATLTISGSNASLVINIAPCLYIEYTTNIFNGYVECNTFYLRAKTLNIPDDLELPNCISLRATT